MPEVRGSNPVIGKTLQWTYLQLTVEKTTTKKKRGREGPFLIKAPTFTERNTEREESSVTRLFVTFAKFFKSLVIFRGFI